MIGNTCLLIRYNEKYFTSGSSHYSSRKGGGGGGLGIGGLSEGLLGFEGKWSTEGNSHRKQRHFSSLGVVGGFSGGHMIFRVNGGLPIVVNRV